MRRYTDSVAIARQVVERRIVERGAVIPNGHRVLRPAEAHLELVALRHVLVQEFEDSGCNKQASKRRQTQPLDPSPIQTLLNIKISLPYQTPQQRAVQFAS